MRRVLTIYSVKFPFQKLEETVSRIKYSAFLFEVMHTDGKVLYLSQKQFLGSKYFEPIRDIAVKMILLYFSKYLEHFRDMGGAVMGGGDINFEIWEMLFRNMKGAVSRYGSLPWQQSRNGPALSAYLGNGQNRNGPAL